MDLYFFDLDKTLYAYDFRRRLPALATMTGASQYHLASSWWAGGYEARAEAGEFPTPAEYLDAFAAVTGTPRLTLEAWASARALAMTRIDGSIAALRQAAGLGTVSLLSNNPSATASALSILAPDVVEILGKNQLFSYMLGARKPGQEIYRRALAHYGCEPQDAFLADDSLANVTGAVSIGMAAHRLIAIDGVYQTDALVNAIEQFSVRLP